MTAWRRLEKLDAAQRAHRVRLRLPESNDLSGAGNVFSLVLSADSDARKGGTPSRLRGLGQGNFLTPPPNAMPSAPDAPTSTRARTRRRSFEIPTLLLLFATFAGWLAVTAAYARWPLLLTAPMAALLISLYSSLQHPRSSTGTRRAGRRSTACSGCCRCPCGCPTTATARCTGGTTSTPVSPILWMTRSPSTGGPRTGRS